MFPIRVNVEYMEHHGGTKFYAVIEMISTRANGEKVVTGCFNFGPIGKVGQFQLETSGIVGKRLADKIRQKSKEGYSETNPPATFRYKSGIAKDVDALSQLLGGKAAQSFGPSFFTMHDPNLYTEYFGQPAGKLPEAMERERAMNAEKDRAMMELAKEEAERARAEQARAAERERALKEESKLKMRANPNFGMF